VFLIRRLYLLLLLASCCFFILFLGARGYVVGARAAAQPPLQAQNLLYLGIVFALATFLFFLALLLRSRNIARELDKTADLARYGSFSFEESLHRLGPLGEKIHNLIAGLIDMSEKKSLRISAMGGINAFLLNNLRLPVLITDITGKVTAASPRAAEKLETERAQLVGRHIKDLVPEVDIQAVVSRLEKEHVEISLGEDSQPITCYPVLNRNSELANVICILGREEVVSADTRAEDRQRVTVQRSRLASLIRRYLRNRR
jgi:PAS domain-containing protein